VNSNSPLALTGLRGSDPLGFLAALGLLRVCSSRPALGTVRLGWNAATGYTAEVVPDGECTEERLIEELLDHMRGRHRYPTFAGQPRGGAGSDEDLDDVKVDPEVFAALLRQTRADATAAHRDSSDFLAALGSELVTAQNKNEVKPTALHMTSGNQKFLETVRDLARSLDPAEPLHEKASCPAADAFREAVFGEWRFADAFSSLGYDPATEAIYALSAAAPTDTGPRSTRAAVWLTVEALPLFPCFPVVRRLHTRGFDRAAWSFRWPVWDWPLTLSAIRTIVGCATLFRPEVSPALLRSYGITAVFEADRVTIGKGYGQFRPGRRAW
jgi:hypothetical protein